MNLCSVKHGCCWLPWRTPRLARQDCHHRGSKWLPACIHAHKKCALLAYCKAFPVATHSTGFGTICSAGSGAVFSLHLPFFLSSFSLPLFFGTLTFQLQAKQPLLFFSWFSRITSSETLWHFKNKSIYLCYLYKPLPLTPGFLFGFETRLQMVWCFPPLVPASSLGCAAQRCCLVMFESHCGRLLQKGLSHCLSEWIQHPLNIELD